ncbi:lipoteichoic acid stability factor AuxB [Staphylococcus shinii]|uniref:lipoteichoic acid stability factor AuxB n=1 Tax=Staphylococcus shinii TaxID=2912228 RepID=UPI00351213C9
MSGEQYTQVRRPVSRLAEKVLGWLSWVFLLLLTIITMFIALVSFSSETSIQNLETTLNGNDFVQQILANNSLNTTQFVIWLQNGVWAIIVYFIVCLLLSFLALISMNIRILSGFLFLLATIVTLPLVLLFVPLIIPILFLIVAVMMFARKDKVETVPAYYGEGYQGRYSEYEQQTGPKPQYSEREQTSDAEQQIRNENQLRRGGYSSEVADKVNAETQEAHEEPQVLSRQAKYNYKHKKQTEDEQQQTDEFGAVSDVYDEHGESVSNQSQTEVDNATTEYDEQAHAEAAQRRQEAYEEEQRRHQEAYEEEQRRKQAEAEEAARLKQEKAEEKARIKQEKKERRKREKERRKQQPSAVNQRRQNFEERKKMTSQTAGDTTEHDSKEPAESDNSEDKK